MKITVTLHLHNDPDGPNGHAFPDHGLHLYGQAARDFATDLGAIDGCDGPHTPAEIQMIHDRYLKTRFYGEDAVREILDY